MAILAWLHKGTVTEVVVQGCTHSWLLDPGFKKMGKLSFIQDFSLRGRVLLSCAECESQLLKLTNLKVIQSEKKKKKERWILSEVRGHLQTPPPPTPIGSAPVYIV